MEEYESKLQFVCENINQREELLNGLSKFPSIQFGLETALLDIQTNGSKKSFSVPQFVRSNYPIKNKWTYLDGKQRLYAGADKNQNRTWLLLFKVKKLEQLISKKNLMSLKVFVLNTAMMFWSSV